MKFLIVVCLGVWLAQGNAQWPGPDEDFDYVIQILNELETELTSEVRSTTENFIAALTDIEGRSTGIIDDLTKEFDEIIAPLVEAIANLDKEGADLGIDVFECTDGTVDSINDLPKELLGVTAMCLNDKTLDAEGVVNEAVAKINNSVSAIDNYWTKIEECAEKTSTQRQICIKELESEVGRDSVDIPDKIALIANEALNDLENLKTELLVCTSGKVNYLVEIGEAIVKNVTACVELIFNPTTATTAAPTTVPPSTTEAPSTTSSAAPTTAPSTIVPTTEPLSTIPTTTSASTTVPSSTTEAPSTTSSAASTTAPSTIVPTTEPLSTVPTTTNASTTVPPSTTEAPSTTSSAAPTTALPTRDSTTEGPTTIPTTTSASTTIPPSN